MATSMRPEAVTLPETNIFAQENCWLGDDPFLFGAKGLFSGAIF